MLQIPFSVNFSGPCLPRYIPGDHGFVTEEEVNRYPSLCIPEINSGFAPAWWYKGTVLTNVENTGFGAAVRPTAAVRGADLRDRFLPLWYKVDTGAGQFRITATLSAVDDVEEALLFVGRRRLCWRGALAAGQRVTVTALCDVSSIIAVGGGDAAESDLGRMEDTSVDVAVVGASLVSLEVESWDGPTLYLMGDSTVTDQPAQTPYAPGTAYAGWGQALPFYLGEQYCVSNHAHSGLSTETFRSRGHFDLLYGLLHPGDAVLIQFGHNDQKRKHLAADTGYTDNLVRYIHELRAAGAQPVLVTSLARNTWSSESAYNDMLAPFAAAVRKVGQEQNVPVLDLHTAMKEAICRVGLESARQWFYPCDFTHTNDFGAYMAAGFVVKELIRVGLAARRDVSDWPVHGPLSALVPPDGVAADPPDGYKPLVDYGLIPEEPWAVI